MLKSKWKLVVSNSKPIQKHIHVVSLMFCKLLKRDFFPVLASTACLIIKSLNYVNICFFTSIGKV